jgi:plastocyanin
VTRPFISRALTGLLAALGAVTIVTASGAAPAKPQSHTVTIDGTSFAPANLTVDVGDRVVWTNKDPFPHTVTAPGKFDSHDIPAGGSWKYVARTAGDYAYICTLHPNMKGMLRVE